MGQIYSRILALQRYAVRSYMWPRAKMSTTSFVLTTNGGLEALVADELRAAAHAAGLQPPIAADDIELRPWNCFGRVLLKRPQASDSSLTRILLGLRGVHDILQHHMVLPLPDCADPPLALYEQLRIAPLTDQGPVPPLLGGKTTFRVSCIREGDHEFTSLDIEREVGGALHELYDAKASMTAFDVRVRVDVAKSTVLIGTALNAEPLSKRHKLAFTRSVTLKPNVAYALLQFAGVASSGKPAADASASAAVARPTVLDPCAGSGTIPLEASEALGLACHGVDKSLAVVKGAQANAAAAGLTELCAFSQGNCRSLQQLFAPASFDAIVTNAPWGVQTAKVSSGKEGEPLLEKIYRGLLLSGHAVTKPGGVMVLLVLRWSLVLDLARRSGLWRVDELLPIRTSNLTPVAVKLVRLDADEPRAQAQARLKELGIYFNFTTNKSGGEAKSKTDDTPTSKVEVAAGGEGDDGVLEVA